MRLAARITILLVLGIFVLLVVAEYISLAHENAEMTEDMRADAFKLTGTVSQIFEEIHRSNGQARALQILDRIDGLNKSLLFRLVYLDVDEGHPDFPRVPEIVRGPRSHICSFEHRDVLGDEHLYTYSSILLESRPAAIELAEPIHHKTKNSYFFLVHTIALLGATTLLGAAMVVAIGGAWIGRPLQRLIQKTRSIGRGDLSERLELKRKDEFGELAEALNSMCDQLQSAQDEVVAETAARDAALNQLRHADRLRTVGRLAAGIAHELGTPLNVISGRASLIASGRLSEEETKKSASAIKSESDRIATIIRQLLDFARRNTPKRTAIDLHALTRQTVELLTPIAEKRKIQLQVTCGTACTTAALDANQIQQVLTNLIVNAVESMPQDDPRTTQGGSVEIGISRQHETPPEGVDGQPGEHLRISVCDHGEGISPDALEHLFEPFFTTKEIGKGTGLGLSIAYGIVQDHGGWIDVASELGNGSCFSVYLPAEVAPCSDES